MNRIDEFEEFLKSDEEAIFWTRSCTRCPLASFYRSQPGQERIGVSENYLQEQAYVDEGYVRELDEWEKKFVSLVDSDDHVPYIHAKEAIALLEGIREELGNE